MKLDPDHEREEFAEWLEDMPAELDRFLDGLPEKMPSQLDLSPESLDALERWLLDRYPDTEAMLADGEEWMLDGLARYIGETIRRNAGGEWAIQLNPDVVHYGIPQLRGFPSPDVPVTPMALATAAADRRTGSFLRSVLEAMMRDYGRRS